MHHVAQHTLREPHPDRLRDLFRALAAGETPESLASLTGIDPWFLHQMQRITALDRVLANMLHCGQNAMAAAKRLILDLSWPERREELSDPYDYVSRMLAELRVSPEGQEGLKAFLEKRKPNWIAEGKA